MGAIRRSALLASLCAAFAAGCGGGSGSTAPDAIGGGSISSSADLAIAARLYEGTNRVPPGFLDEPRPPNVSGTVATLHLKSRDVATSAATQFELCTDDPAQAIAWSESRALWQGQYSDLVETRTEARFFEVSRVPRADVNALVRHRLFRCSFLDRSSSDLALDEGAAGVLNRRPVTADELRALTEYLWHFTLFNNADHAVVTSNGDGAAPQLRHTIRMARLVRSGASQCDSVELFDWTHLADTGSGTLSRSLTPFRSFRARSTANGAELCLT
jgi:hypothetical protein